MKSFRCSWTFSDKTECKNIAEWHIFADRVFRRICSVHLSPAKEKFVPLVPKKTEYQKKDFL